MSAEVPSLLARVPEPALTFDGHETEGAPTGNRALSGRQPVLLRPLPLASAALILVAFMLILTQVILREPGPSPSDRQATLAALKPIPAALGDLRGAVIDVESSLDREREILERSILSALDYLQEGLNIKIERRDRPRSL